jgi:hypothetical protein
MHKYAYKYTYCHVSGVPWLIITGFGLDDWIYWHFYYNYTQQLIIDDCLRLSPIRSLLDYECLLFSCDWLGSDLRIGHFFSFRCPLVNTPQLHTQSRLQDFSSTNCLRWLLVYEWLQNQLLVLLDLGANRIQNTTSKSTSVTVYILCRGNVLTEPLPSNRPIRIYSLLCKRGLIA